MADGLEKPWQTTVGFKDSNEELVLRVLAFPPADPIPQTYPTRV